MGSLYNMVCGEDPLAEYVLAVLGLKREDCGRYRDACVIPGSGQPSLMVFTRLGEGAWADDEQMTAAVRLRAHPEYLKDEVWEFDRTFRCFYFRVPEDFRRELVETIPQIIEAGAWDFATPMERFHRAIEEMKRGA